MTGAVVLLVAGCKTVPEMESDRKPRRHRRVGTGSGRLGPRAVLLQGRGGAGGGRPLLRGSLAVLWYEYGRTYGAVCDWAQAERGLARALDLDRQASGPVHMDLYETARL